MNPVVWVAILASVIECTCCASAVACLQRREYVRAVRQAKYAVLACVVSPFSIGLVALLSALGSQGTASKAEQLARGIATGMNAGVLDVPVAVIACVLWIIARRRLGKPR